MLKEGSSVKVTSGQSLTKGASAEQRTSDYYPSSNAGGGMMVVLSGMGHTLSILRRCSCQDLLKE